MEHKPAPSPATAAQAAPAPPPVACDSEPLRVPAYVLPDRATYLAALSSAGTGLGNLVLSEEPQNTDAAGYLAAVHAAISESVYSEVAGSLLSDGVESSAQPAVQPRILLKGVRIGSSAESLQGWGDLLNRGTLNQSGRVVADGLGQMRTLDLSRVAAIQNSFDNPLTGENGWYAQNGGKLVLPPLDIATGTNTYTWGEQDDDPVLDLINSVRVKLVDVTRAAPVEIALLAVDRPDLPALPAGHTPIGLWSFSATGLEAAAVELSVRYDDVLARRLQLSESTLKLWGYDQEGWHLLTDAFFCDVNNKLISARAESLSYFAVTSPEPSGMLLAVGLAAALASRRQRRR